MRSFKIYGIWSQASKCEWRSQDIAVARAQHGHTTFVRASARSAEAYGGGGPPPENLGILREAIKPGTERNGTDRKYLMHNTDVDTGHVGRN